MIILYFTFQQLVQRLVWALVLIFVDNIIIVPLWNIRLHYVFEIHLNLSYENTKYKNMLSIIYELLSSLEIRLLLRGGVKSNSFFALSLSQKQSRTVPIVLYGVILSKEIINIIILIYIKLVWI